MHFKLYKVSRTILKSLSSDIVHSENSTWSEKTEKLFDKYLHHKSPFCVNISYHTSQNLQDALYRISEKTDSDDSTTVK